MAGAAEIDVRLLGPVEVATRDGPVQVGGPRTRALVAVLALERGGVVSRSRIVDVLWGEDSPRRAKESVQMHVSRVRRGLAVGGVTRDRLVAVADGYRLDLRDGECDLDRWDAALAAARAARDAGDARAATAHLDAALGLWRGEPLAGIDVDGRLTPERAKLEEQRLAARLARAEMALDAGRHADAVAELEGLAAEHPYDEGVARRHMLALYRMGRQADALDAFTAVRGRLVADLGLEPGVALRELQEAILRQDGGLDPAWAGLPPALRAATSLAGREPELGWLEGRWSDARQGRGAVVLLSGLPGSGRTRLAAELAARVHGLGAPVLHAAGASSALDAALSAAAAATSPVLVVLDDLDAAPSDAVRRLEELTGTLPRRPALVVATTAEPPPPALGRLVERLGRADALRRLGPLDAPAVERIATGYATNGAAVPVDALLASSAGLPERVHRAAWAWARTEAAERVRRVAVATGATRATLADAESTLAGDVAELQRLRRRLPEPRGTRPTAPYRGLAQFEAGDARLFFGRERLVAHVVARMAGAPVVALVGASGVGKSSLLRAGLLPALAGGALPGLEHARPLLMRPGPSPVQALRDAVAGHPAPALLAVDQLEEALAPVVAPAQRIEFLDALVAAAEDGSALVLAVRADFLPACAAHDGFARLLDGRTVLVGAMRPDELRAAIELPAQAAGVRVDVALTDALVRDAGEEPGALPLLSTTLLELWQHREAPDRLSLADHERRGGMRGAVARLAEEAFARMAPEARAATRQLLPRLAATEGGVTVRRRVALADLPAGPAAREALDGLVAGRLLVVGDGAVEVAHEALFGEWPRLAGWLAEDVERLRVHAHLSRAAAEWTSRGRDPGDLYRGARLASAAELAGAARDGLSEVEREFLDASGALAVEDAARTRRTNRRLRGLLAVAAGLLVIATAAALVAGAERRRSRDEATAADAQRLGAQAQVERRLDRALLMAVAGLRVDDDLETRSTLLAALLRSPAAVAELHGDGGRLLSAALSPDSQALAVGDNDGTVLLFDTRAPGRPPARLQLAPLQIHALDFAAGGRLLAVAGTAPDGGRVELVDARAGRALTRFPVPAGQQFTGVAIDPGGAAVYATSAALEPGARAALLGWSTSSRRPLGRPVALPPGDGAIKLALIPRTDRVLVATDGAGGLLLDRDGRRVRAYPRASGMVAVSADGRRFVTGTYAGDVRVFDVATGVSRRLGGRQPSPVQSIAFAADGRTVVTATDDGIVKAWDVVGGEEREVFAGHSGRVPALAISRDGASVYSAALEGTIIAWDLRGSRRLGRRFDAGATTTGWPTFAVDPRTGAVVIPQSDGGLRVVARAGTGATRNVRLARATPIAGAAFSRDGRRLAVTDGRGEVRLLDPRSLRIVRSWHGHRTNAPGIAFSPDGRTLATAGWDRSVRLWRLPGGGPVRRLRVPTPAHSVAFSPDGRTIAVGRDLSPLEVHDAATGRRVARLGGVGDAFQGAFSPDGRTLAVGGVDGRVTLWDTRAWHREGAALERHPGFAMFVSWSPDGLRLASGGSDGDARLWDVASRTLIGRPLPGPPYRPAAPAFAPGGRLVSVSDAGQGLSWDVSLRGWVRHACAVAGRELTRAEWSALVPRRPYRAVCGR